MDKSIIFIIYLEKHNSLVTLSALIAFHWKVLVTGDIFCLQCVRSATI
jgi:hypothetical protein